MNDTATAQTALWVHIQDPRTPSRRLIPAGRWRDGKAMHGIYERRREDGLVEGVAVWHGWPQHAWAGPAMRRFSSPLVSAWNPVLAQALKVWEHTPGPGVDHEAWTAEAIIGGWKPFGYFGGPWRVWRGWAEEAEVFGVASRVERMPLTGVCITAGREETYAEMFDLDALIADYAEALPAELADPQIKALDDHRGKSPADYVDRFDQLENGPEAICGLTLGYPPSVTAGCILGHYWGHYAEYGALPNPAPREQLRFAFSRPATALWGGRETANG